MVYIITHPPLCPVCPACLALCFLAPKMPRENLFPYAIAAQGALFGAAAIGLSRSAPFVGRPSVDPNVWRQEQLDLQRNRERRDRSDRRAQKFTRFRHRFMPPKRKRSATQNRLLQFATPPRPVSVRDVRQDIVARWARANSVYGPRNRSFYPAPFARKMPYRRRKRYRRKGRRRKYGSTRGAASAIRAKEERSRRYANRRAKPCRSVLLIPPRCRDKLICSIAWATTATSGTADVANKTWIDQNFQSGGTLRALRIDGTSFPFLNFNSAATGCGQSPAGWGMLQARYNSCIYHGMSVDVQCNAAASAHPLRFALVPARIETAWQTAAISAICDGEASTHMTMTGSHTSQNTMRKVGAAVTTAALYGRKIAGDDAFEHDSDAVAGGFSPSMILYYGARTLTVDLAAYFNITVMIDVEFLNADRDADVDPG